MAEFRKEHAGSPTLVRDNGNGSKTTRTYQDVSDRNLARDTQHSENKPLLTYVEVTTRDDS